MCAGWHAIYLHNGFRKQIIHIEVEVEETLFLWIFGCMALRLSGTVTEENELQCQKSRCFGLRVQNSILPKGYCDIDCHTMT